MTAPQGQEEYVRTTFEVEEWYCAGGFSDEDRRELRAEFRAWLAEHDAQVIAADNVIRAVLDALGKSYDHDPVIAAREAAAVRDRFDAWLPEHDAEVAARAYDEGHRVGWEHCQDGNYGTDAWDDDTPNPYRQEGDR